MIFYSYCRFLFLQVLLANIFFFLFVVITCLWSIFTSMFQDESFFKMFIFIFSTLIKYSRIKEGIFLHISLSQYFIFAFFKIQELILHIDSLIIFDDNDFIIRVVTFILKSTEFLHVDLFGTVFLVNLHSVNFKFFCIFKGYEFFLEAVFIVTNVMWYFEMDFQFVIIFVVSVFLLFSTDIASVVFQVNMYSKLVFVKEIFWAEFTIWMHERDISKLVYISFL